MGSILNIKEKLETPNEQTSDELLSSILNGCFAPIFETEKALLLDSQRKKLADWNNYRKTFVEAQVCITLTLFHFHQNISGRKV